MSAIGSAIIRSNTGLGTPAIVDFIEFTGEGRPGYSGGPVLNMEGRVVGLMREAWTKRGVKGGAEYLVNRAFSVELISVLEEHMSFGR